MGNQIYFQSIPERTSKPNLQRQLKTDTKYSKPISLNHPKKMLKFVPSRSPQQDKINQFPKSHKQLIIFLLITKCKKVKKMEFNQNHSGKITP